MYEIDYIKTAIPKIEATIKSKDDEIAKLKNSDFGKFKDYVCNSSAWSQYKGIELSSSGGWGYGYQSRPYSTPEAAMEALDKVYAAAKVVDDKNIEITKHNDALRNKLITLCESVGLQKSKRQLKKRTRNTYETVDIEWYAGLKHCGPTRHYSNRNTELYYKQEKQKIEKWSQGIKDELVAKEKEEAEKKAERKKNLVLSALITKYQLDEDVEENEILDHILSKCKYLKLAHYLQANRNDWNDGPDYAQRGLNGFTANSSVDEEIYAEISSLINDWDGDGRCFRDCRYNYNELFSYVSPDLFNDYEKAAALVGE